MSNQLKNDLLLKALKGEKVSRPPVWMMRQAGRYLPEYMALREKYSFLERMKTPELACEITIQPIDIVGTDAAIIFSDILTIPEALGVEFDLVKGKGPVMKNPVRDEKAAYNIDANNLEDKVEYVNDALKLTKKELNNRVPLIGFAGAPWTLFCYMIEGQGSKNFAKAKEFAYTHPKAAKHILQQLSLATIEYLKGQIASGADTVQLFDSWAGLLGPEDFKEWSLPFLTQISAAIDEVPVIVFAKGSWYALKEISEIPNAAAVGLDWTIPPKFARENVTGDITVQGNFDPTWLLGERADIIAKTKNMINEFGVQNYIANLGHGILPNVPVDNAKAFVNTVKEYTA